MKKMIAVLLIGCMTTVLFSGCSSRLNVTTSTVKLLKNGKVMEASVEPFGEYYYDADELEEYVTETVETYTSEYGKKTVSIEKSEVEEDTAYLTLQFDCVNTFSEFDNLRCFSGSIKDAQSLGFDFDTMFYDVNSSSESEGSQESEESLYKIVSKDEVLAQDDLKVFVLKDNVDVIVPGTIQYVSTDMVTGVEKDTVHVQAKENDTDESVLVYVLYK